MAGKFELAKLQSKYSNLAKSVKEKSRAGIDAAEIGAGAAVAGYLDVAVPSIAGIPTSAGLGIALFVAGTVAEQRDIAYLGTGMLAGAAYKQGASLAMSRGSMSGSESDRKAM